MLIRPSIENIFNTPVNKFNINFIHGLKVCCDIKEAKTTIETKKRISLDEIYYKFVFCYAKHCSDK